MAKPNPEVIQLHCEECIARGVGEPHNRRLRRSYEKAGYKVVVCPGLIDVAFDKQEKIPGSEVVVNLPEGQEASGYVKHITGQRDCPLGIAPSILHAQIVWGPDSAQSIKNAGYWPPSE